MSKEAKARIKINKLLEETGWRFFDSKEGRANIVLENKTKLSQTELDEFGEDFEKTKKLDKGFIKTIKFNFLGCQGMIFHIRNIFKDLDQVYQITDFSDFDFDLAGFTH